MSQRANVFLAVPGVGLKQVIQSLRSCSLLPKCLLHFLRQTMTVGNMESVVLFDAGTKGRGLKAKKDISPGEVLFAEPSFSAVVFDR